MSVAAETAEPGRQLLAKAAIGAIRRARASNSGFKDAVRQARRSRRLFGAS
jgi:hypothetical protein